MCLYNIVNYNRVLSTYERRKKKKEERNVRGVNKEKGKVNSTKQDWIEVQG